MIEACGVVSLEFDRVTVFFDRFSLCLLFHCRWR